MYRLPKGMRYSTLEERRSFYSEEFSLEGVASWLGRRENTVFAVILGRHTGIYLPEYRDIRRNTVIIDDYRGLGEVREYILQYLPEGVYYDRNLYKSLEVCRRCDFNYRDCWGCENFLGQELAFDIDPENVDCPYHGSGEERMERGQGLGFCMHEFRVVRGQARRLYRELRGQFSKIRIVYSGRGFHLHVRDEAAAMLGKAEREELASELATRYAIDEWVTAGEMRLIRLPYALHGMVSRVCIPLAPEEMKGFDPRREARCLPRFLS